MGAVCIAILKEKQFFHSVLSKSWEFDYKIDGTSKRLADDEVLFATDLWLTDFSLEGLTSERSASVTYAF